MGEVWVSGNCKRVLRNNRWLRPWTGESCGREISRGVVAWQKLRAAWLGRVEDRWHRKSLFGEYDACSCGQEIDKSRKFLFAPVARPIEQRHIPACIRRANRVMVFLVAGYRLVDIVLELLENIDSTRI